MESATEIDRFTNKKFTSLEINSNLDSLIHLLENDNVQSVFITDSKDHLMGFISAEILLKNSKNPISLKKITSKLPLVRDFDQDKIIECFLDKNSLQIPIVDQKEMINSVVDIYKLAQDYLVDEHFDANEIIEDIPIKLDKNEKIDSLLAHLKKNYVDYIVVEEGGQFAGFVNPKNLVNVLIKPERSSRGSTTGEKLKFEGTVENYITDNNAITLTQQELFSAKDLLEIMQKNNSTVVYVKNKKNDLLGMISLRKMLNMAFNPNKIVSDDVKIAVLSAPDETIEGIARKKVATLLGRHAKFFASESDSEGTVRFHKIENQSQKGMFKYETDLRISFGKGKDSVFSIKADDWGAEKSLNKAYSKISRLISDKRKITSNTYHKKELL